jgi:hypothetical protein
MASLAFGRDCLRCSCRFTSDAPEETLDLGLPRADDGGARIATPLVGIIFGVDVSWSGAALGETIDLGLPDHTIATCDIVLPLWGIVFGAVTS